MGNIKSTIFIGLIILFSLVGASQAHAALEIVEPNVTVNVDYGDFTTEDQNTVRETFTFTVRNTNLDDATLGFSFTGIPNGYNATPIETIDLMAGEERTITSTIEVPHTRGSGQTNIGSLIMRDSNTNAEVDRVPINQNTLSMLIIDKINVAYTDTKGNSRSDKFDGSVVNPKLRENVRPGSELNIQITYKNIFDRGYDSDKSAIEDIVLNIDPSDSDLFSDGQEDSVDLSDLDANEKDIYEATYVVSDDIDADTYSVDYSLEGTDANNYDHIDKKTLSLDVERQRNDVRIDRSDITTPIETCDTYLSLDLQLKNYGTRDQKYTAVSLSNTELGLDYKLNDLLLEKFGDQDTYHTQVQIPLTKPLKEGAKSLDLKVFIDRDSLMEQKTIPIQITKCGQSQTPADASTNNTTSSPATGNGSAQSTVPNQTNGSASTTSAPGTHTGNTSPVSVSGSSAGSTVIQTVEEPYSTDDFFVGGLIVAIIVVVALIVVFFILLLR